MKAQLQELKQMMRVSFDLQLDIQRAIRQEVAAALTAFCNPPGASAQATVAGVGPALVPPCGKSASRQLIFLLPSKRKTKTNSLIIQLF